MSRLISFMSLGFIAAAFAVPIAQSQSPSSTPKVDPLAVGYLIGPGYTQQQVGAWTVGPCSHAAKPPACFGPSRGANLVEPAKVDPLAVGYLTGRGLSPREVRSWTVGACSHAVKAASCFAAFDRDTPIATPAGERIVDDYWRDPTPAAAPAVSIGRTGAFDWGDAGIGAGAALGIALLVGGTAAALMLARQSRRRVAST